MRALIVVAYETAGGPSDQIGVAAYGGVSVHGCDLGLHPRNGRARIGVACAEVIVPACTGAGPLMIATPYNSDVLDLYGIGTQITVPHWAPLLARKLQL